MTAIPTPSTPFLDDQAGQQSPPAPPPAPVVRPSLRRSSTDKMLGGVCGGLAEHTGIDALVWRVGFVGLTLAGGSGVLVYLLLWVLMAPGPRPSGEQAGSLDRLAEQAHAKVYATGWLPPRP
jgi:phage shock protein PspC (stress-responsive transcriptional regulator)